MNNSFQGNLPALVSAEDGYRTQPYSDQDNNAFGIDIATILGALRRNLVWIVALMALALGAGIVITLLITPRYVATATVLVEQEADQIIEGADTQPAVAYQDTERFLQTQLDIIRSRSLAEQVLEGESLIDDPNYYAAFNSEMPVEADLDNVLYAGADGLERLRRTVATDLLIENMSVTLPLDSRLVSIGMETTSPAMSARIANAVARNYIESNLSRKFESSAYAREFLAQQLEEARNALADSERNLNTYSRAAGLIRTSSQGDASTTGAPLSVTNSTLVQINEAANEAVATRIAAEEEWQSIANAPLLTIPQVLASSAIQNLLRLRSQAEAELAEERARHLDQHPTVQALEAQVQRYTEQINDVAKSIREAVQRQYQSALDREKSMREQVNQLRQEALSEQDQGVQYNVLLRVAETNRSNYDALLQRYNELNATAGAASNNVSLVDAAELPTDPSSPNLPLNILVSLIAGMCLAGGFVFLREHFDDVIRSPDDVERKLGIPLLGLIPRAEDDDAFADAKEDQKSAISEAYHSLVTNLFYATSKGLPEVLMVTSSQASEGKTTTSSIIATYLARLGHNVVLIDGDLRRPTLHKRLLNNSDQPGITEVLSGRASLDDVVVSEEGSNLSYITALPIPPDPSLLLGSPALDTMISELRERFDVVIVDCPPILGLSDSVAWSTKVDGTLLVVDATKGHRGAIKAGQRRMQLVGAPMLGAVLTKFNPDAAGGNYSYYGYEYYAYGDDEKDR